MLHTYQEQFLGVNLYGIPRHESDTISKKDHFSGTSQTK